jgi:hypothetical protein
LVWAAEAAQTKHPKLFSTTFASSRHALGVHDRDTPGTQDNLVILDYGYPAKQGNTYGVFLIFDETGAVVLSPSS